MAQKKPTMKKDDVEKEIGRVFEKNFMNYEIQANVNPPKNVYRVFAKIKDEYYGEGIYLVQFDFYGDIPMDEGNGNMRGHFETTCEVEITSDSDKSPNIEIISPLFLHKQIL